MLKLFEIWVRRSDAKYFAMVVLVAFIATPVDADDRSHRLIETPQLEGVDFNKQIEMLRRLQTLADQLESPKPTAGEFDHLPEQVTAEDIERLKKLFNRMGMQPPPGQQSSTPEFFPGPSQTQKNPPLPDIERSKLLEELMRRLSGDVPQIDPSTLDNDMKANNPSGDNSTHNDSSDKPDRRPGYLVGSRRDPADKSMVPESNSAKSGAEDFNPENTSNSRQRHQNSTLPNPSSDEQRPKVPSSSPDDVPPAQQLSSEDSTIDGSVRKRAGSLFDQTMQRDFLGGRSGQPDASSLPRNGAFDDPSSAADSKSDSRQANVPDWMKALRQLNQQESQAEPGSTATPSSGPGRTSGNDVSATDQSKLTELAKSLGDSASIEDLAKSLRKTLQEASQQAQKQTRAESNSIDEKVFDWSKVAGMQSVLKDTADQLAESLKSETGRSRNTGRSGQSNSANRSGTVQSLRDALAPVRNVANRANHIIMSTPSSNRRSSESGSSSLPSPALPGFGSIMLSIAVIAGGVLGYALLRRLRHSQTIREREELREMIVKMQTRNDVVIAFHRIAALSNAVLGHWWTHQRAAGAMAEATPDKSATLEVLAGLYERARYLPPDHDLSQDDLEAARHAIEKLMPA